MSLLLPAPYFSSAGTAAIWLPPSTGHEPTSSSFDDLKTIDVSLFSEPLRNFLFRQLPQILELSRKEVHWHYNPLCRNCPYDYECRSKALEGELGSMPNISLDEAKILKRMLAVSRDHENQSHIEVPDIEELHTLIGNQNKFNALEHAFPRTIKKAKRILGLQNRIGKRRSPTSPVVEAARDSIIKVWQSRIPVVVAHYPICSHPSA